MAPALLAFEGGGSCPVQYWITIDSKEWFVRYRWGELEVYRSEDGDVDFTDDEVQLDVRIGDGYDGYWNARETNVYLTAITNAIQSGSF